MGNLYYAIFYRLCEIYNEINLKHQHKVVRQ